MSLSTIDQSTGNATVISGNVNDKVGNLAALTTTDKSSCVGAINEVKSGLIGVGHIRTETVTLTGGEPGTDGSFIIENFGDTSPSIIQIMEVGGAKALLPANWWVSGGTLYVQYTIVSSSAYIGGGVYVHMIIA